MSCLRCRRVSGGHVSVRQAGGAGVALALALLVPLSGAGRLPVPAPAHFDLAAAAAGAGCAPLPPPRGRVVRVSTVSQLVRAVDDAATGTTILVADGTYNFDGAFLRLDTANLTVRSASGIPDSVVLDGNYRTAEIVQIVASNVTVADLTLREAYDHPIHVMSGEHGDTANTLIYNVRVVDPGQQAIKINPVAGGGFTDRGVVACSRLELTDAGRPRVRDNCYTGGVDAHASRDWVIRDNVIQGFWCDSGLAEHGIHFWKVSRDPVVERNVLRNNARGIGFGMATSGEGRVYPDPVCPGATGYVDHVGGIIRNNAVSADDTRLFRSADGFDCGICLWNACGVRALHNTVYTTNPARTFSAIEWRFANTRADVVNNLVNHLMRERDGARAEQAGNVTAAPAGWFVNAAGGDLHLAPAAAGAIDRVRAPRDVPDDLDGDARPPGDRADAGADELGAPRAPAPPVLRPAAPGGREKPGPAAFR